VYMCVETIVLIRMFVSYNTFSFFPLPTFAPVAKRKKGNSRRRTLSNLRSIIKPLIGPTEEYRRWHSGVPVMDGSQFWPNLYTSSWERKKERTIQKRGGIEMANNHIPSGETIADRCWPSFLVSKREMHGEKRESNQCRKVINLHSNLISVVLLLPFSRGIH